MSEVSGGYNPAIDTGHKNDPDIPRFTPPVDAHVGRSVDASSSDLDEVNSILSNIPNLDKGASLIKSSLNEPVSVKINTAKPGSIGAKDREFTLQTEGPINKGGALVSVKIDGTRVGHVTARIGEENGSRVLQISEIQKDLGNNPLMINKDTGDASKANHRISEIRGAERGHGVSSKFGVEELYVAAVREQLIKDGLLSREDPIEVVKPEFNPSGTPENTSKLHGYKDLGSAVMKALPEVQEQLKDLFPNDPNVFKGKPADVGRAITSRIDQLPEDVREGYGNMVKGILVENLPNSVPENIRGQLDNAKNIDDVIKIASPYTESYGNAFGIYKEGFSDIPNAIDLPDARRFNGSDFDTSPVSQAFRNMTGEAVEMSSKPAEQRQAESPQSPRVVESPPPLVSRLREGIRPEGPNPQTQKPATEAPPAKPSILGGLKDRFNNPEANVPKPNIEGSIGKIREEMGEAPKPSRVQEAPKVEPDNLKERSRPPEDQIKPVEVKPTPQPTPEATAISTPAPQVKESTLDPVSQPNIETPVAKPVEPTVDPWSKLSQSPDVVPFVIEKPPQNTNQPENPDKFRLFPGGEQRNGPILKGKNVSPEEIQRLISTSQDPESPFRDYARSQLGRLGILGTSAEATEVIIPPAESIPEDENVRPKGVETKVIPKGPEVQIKPIEVIPEPQPTPEAAPAAPPPLERQPVSPEVLAEVKGKIDEATEEMIRRIEADEALRRIQQEKIDGIEKEIREAEAKEKDLTDRKTGQGAWAELGPDNDELKDLVGRRFIISETGPKSELDEIDKQIKDKTAAIRKADGEASVVPGLKSQRDARAAVIGIIEEDKEKALTKGAEEIDKLDKDPETAGAVQQIIQGSQGKNEQLGGIIKEISGIIDEKYKGLPPKTYSQTLPPEHEDARQKMDGFIEERNKRIDPETGQIRGATPGEIIRNAAILRALIDPKTDIGIDPSEVIQKIDIAQYIRDNSGGPTPGYDDPGAYYSGPYPEPEVSAPYNPYSQESINARRAKEIVDDMNRNGMRPEATNSLLGRLGYGDVTVGGMPVQEYTNVTYNPELAAAIDTAIREGTEDRIRRGDMREFAPDDDLSRRMKWGENKGRVSKDPEPAPTVPTPQEAPTNPGGTSRTRGPETPNPESEEEEEPAKPGIIGRIIGAIKNRERPRIQDPETPEQIRERQKRREVPTVDPETPEEREKRRPPIQDPETPEQRASRKPRVEDPETPEEREKRRPPIEGAMPPPPTPPIQEPVPAPRPEVTPGPGEGEEPSSPAPGPNILGILGGLLGLGGGTPGRGTPDTVDPDITPPATTTETPPRSNSLPPNTPTPPSDTGGDGDIGDYSPNTAPNTEEQKKPESPTTTPAVPEPEATQVPEPKKPQKSSKDKGSGRNLGDLGGGSQWQPPVPQYQPNPGPDNDPYAGLIPAPEVVDKYPDIIDRFREAHTGPSKRPYEDIVYTDPDNADVAKRLEDMLRTGKGFMTPEDMAKIGSIVDQIEARPPEPSASPNIPTPLSDPEKGIRDFVEGLGKDE